MTIPRAPETKPPPVVGIVTWRGTDPQTGERDTLRFSLEHEGRAIVTRGSKIKVRRYARLMRWRVEGEG